MAQYDLSGLGPEEIEGIKAALAGMGGGEPDKGDVNAEFVRVVTERLDGIDKMVDQMWQDLNGLKDFFFNKFMKNLEDLYKDNQHSVGVEAMRGKYGADFEPHMGFIKANFGDEDIFGKLFDHVSSHYDDEGFDPDEEVDNILDQLEDKIEEMRKVLGGGSETDKVEEKDEGEESEEPEEAQSEPVDFTEEIRKLRKMPGMRAAAGE